MLTHPPMTLAAAMLTWLALALATAGSAHAANVCGLNPRGDYYLSLRKGPGTNNAEMLRLAEGTYVEVLESRRNWLKVIADGSFVGWVSARYICD